MDPLPTTSIDSPAPSAATAPALDALDALDPASAGRIEEANRRDTILEGLRQLRATDPKISYAVAASVLGVPAATLWRYDRASSEAGFSALIPRTANCGRRAVRLSDDEARRGQFLAVRTGSVELAGALLAESGHVRDNVLPLLARMTPTIRRQLRPTKEIEDMFRGPDRASLQGYWQPRSLTYEAADGTVRELEPGDLFERDDMTVNFGWTVDWPWGGDACSDKFGVRLLRGQLLACIDVASLRVLSFELLARLQDSYRMDDVWAWMGRGYHDHGMPRIGERLEGGIWQGSAIKGQRAAAHDGTAYSEGHTASSVRIGGLRALGLHIVRSYRATTKIIESRFDITQALQGLIPGQLGRRRGEMERENRLWLRCREGKEDPRKYFLPQSEAATRIYNAFAWLNSEPVDGRVYKGVPDELWARRIAERPLARVAPDRAWLFARDRADVAIRRGLVTVKRTGPQGQAWYFFSHPSFATLGSGYPVMVYFDPLAPEQPAVIVDRTSGRDAGRVLCVAEAVEEVPQFSLMEDSAISDRGFVRRRAFAEAVRTEYRAMGLAGGKGTAITQVTDGRGGLTQIERGRRTEEPTPSAPARETAPAPAPAREREPMTAPARDRDSMMELLG